MSRNPIYRGVVQYLLPQGRLPASPAALGHGDFHCSRPWQASTVRRRRRWRPSTKPNPDSPLKELVTRLLADVCDVCQQPGEVEVHHVRTLADLGQPGPLQPQWAKAIANRRRMTLVVCGWPWPPHTGQPATPLTQRSLESRTIGKPSNPVRREAARKGPAQRLAPRCAADPSSMIICADAPSATTNDFPQHHAAMAQRAMMIIMTSRLARYYLTWTLLYQGLKDRDSSAPDRGGPRCRRLAAGGTCPLPASAASPAPEGLSAQSI